jgi:hypothetical protein
MGEVKIKGLIERFADLPGKRVVGRTAHDLLDIVVTALCAVMSRAQGQGRSIKFCVIAGR